jgi:hypothetical protein
MRSLTAHEHTHAGAPDRAEALAERLFGATLGALELFSVYLGAELGLYRTLAGYGPLTPAELGERAGIAERYAQEWLEQQAVAGLVEVEDAPAGAHERHYTGFGLSRLWATDATGARVGHSPVRTARKVSFCIVDIEIDAWAEKGNGPRTYPTPECLVPTESDAENDYLVQGLTPGWADVYDWFLPDQFIEVSGVADGIYLLETIAYPDNTILEANESNSCGSVYVRLSNIASSPTAELLGPGPPCKRSTSRRTQAGSHPHTRRGL